MRKAALLVFWLAACNAAGALAAPYIPADDQQVLDRARLANSDPLSQELKKMRRKLTQTPDNLELALQLAQGYITATRNTSDPRYLGYAEAALAPWWQQPAPPVPVLLMRATLKQSTHDFEGALVDLDTVVKVDPGNAQGWLTLATVQNVRAKYRDAAQSCARLAALAGELVTAGCLAEVGSVAGQAHDAYQTLQIVLARNPRVAGPDRVWVLTLLGEMAARMRLTSAADAYFKQALAVGHDAYLKGAYADFLLDAGRPREVIQLLQQDIAADPLLLRLAIAEQALNEPNAAAHGEMLRQRFDAARMRGDIVHRREESRFALHLMNDPPRALELARANWLVQREPADARVLLEAALANKDAGAAQVVLTWMRGNGVEDVNLTRLAAGIAQLPQTGRVASTP